MAQKKAAINLSTRRIINSVTIWMQKKGYNRTRAARECGLAYPTFTAVMNGKMVMSTKTAVKMLHACDCKLAPAQKK